MLLRAAVGGLLVAQGGTALAHGPESAGRALVAGSSVLAGLALLLGGLTPIAVVAVAALTLAGLAGGAAPETGALLLVMDVAVGLLGPGAYSVDARLFGRREIQVPRAPRA